MINPVTADKQGVPSKLTSGVWHPSAMVERGAVLFCPERSGHIFIESTGGSPALAARSSVAGTPAKAENVALRTDMEYNCAVSGRIFYGCHIIEVLPPI